MARHPRKVRIGQAIEDARRRRDISERDAGGMLDGVSQATVNRWTQGDSVPALDRAGSIARFLSTPQRRYTAEEIREWLRAEHDTRGYRKKRREASQLEELTVRVRRLEETLREIGHHLGL